LVDLALVHVELEKIENLARVWRGRRGQWRVGHVAIRRQPISFRSVGRSVSMTLGGRRV